MEKREKNVKKTDLTKRGRKDSLSGYFSQEDTLDDEYPESWHMKFAVQRSVSAPDIFKDTYANDSSDNNNSLGNLNENLNIQNSEQVSLKQKKKPTLRVCTQNHCTVH